MYNIGDVLILKNPPIDTRVSKLNIVKIVGVLILMKQGPHKLVDFLVISNGVNDGFKRS